ncbi:glutaminase A [Streptomyces monticola]|uniref:Glutaminase n=1 Tax=Streptomyces monticola TaxID=2666263 RepID=A0ABW2JPJ5_9ACTN
MAAKARLVRDTRAFGIAILVSVLGNATVLGLETYPGAVAHWGHVLHGLENVFLALFAAELIVRAAACADRPRTFFRDRWNVFDALVLALTLLPFLSANASVARLLRLARVLRTVRMLPHVRLIATAVGRSIPGASGFLVVGGLALYVYAMIGWMLFGQADPEHYGSVGSAALTLFLLITLDGLGDMVRDGLAVSAWAVPFYVSFVLLASFVLVNTLIGVVISALEEARQHARTATAAPPDTSESDGVGELSGRIDELSQAMARVERALTPPLPASAPLRLPEPNHHHQRKETAMPHRDPSGIPASRSATNGHVPTTPHTHRPAGRQDAEEDPLRAVFDAFDDDGNGSLSRLELVSRITKAGILSDDPRIADTLAATLEGERELDFDEFAALVREHGGLLRRVVQDQLIVPDFGLLAREIDATYEELRDERGGAVADYIPQLARTDPDSFGIAVCTVDGQRHLAGDARTMFCVQSVSKTVGYCLALEEHGIDGTHQHVGREPSGLGFNEVTFNQQGLPHNPMINAGAIISASLIRPGEPLSDRYEHVERTWQRLAGGRRPGFSNSVYLSERATADRNFALGYLMRERGAFPEGTDLREALEFYFQCCSVEVDADMLAMVAATFANGGICPLTGDRVFGPDTVQHCQSLMMSCGMYDFSGEFAFSIGLPAKSGVSGALMIVVPQVMGIAVWSPRLDSQGNTVRGIEFCKRLVERYVVHPHDAAEGQSGRRDIRRRPDQTTLEAVVHLCWAAAQGDLDEVRRLLATGAAPDDGDYDGRTPLHLAASEGRSEVVRYLLAHGASPGRTDRWGNTPLDDAERAGWNETAALLRSPNEPEPLPARDSQSLPPQRR